MSYLKETKSVLAVTVYVECESGTFVYCKFVILIIKYFTIVEHSRFSYYNIHYYYGQAFCYHKLMSVFIVCLT